MQRKRREVGQVPFEKPFFLLNGGLNTEASPLNAPDNTTIDECNLEILRDGTRRRRRAIADESGAVIYEYAPSDADDISVFSRSNSFQWDNVGGDPTLTFQVVKIGGRIHFYVDSTTLSAGKKSFVIPLFDYATTSVVNDVIGNPVTFAAHQGVLFASAKYVHPMYITYDATADSVSTTPITVRVRDLTGVPDEEPINTKPLTLTSSHEYNIVNRGWNSGINSTDGYGYLKFFGDTGRYPAKNMIPWRGYSKKAETGKNTSDSAYNPADWSKSYSSAKLEAEIFGSSDAPQGHLLLDPFDTTYAQVGSGVGAQNVTAVTAQHYYSIPPPNKRVQVFFTVPAPHGLSVTDPVEVTGGTVSYTYKPAVHGGPGKIAGTFPLTGVHEVFAVQSTTAFSVLIYDTDNTYNRIFDLYEELSPPRPDLVTWDGPTTAGSDPLLNELTGVTTNLRPTAVEMFAGRVWYGGFGAGAFSDTLLFSQLILNSATDYEKYGKCFQAGDPTDEFRAMVVPTDGGTVQIPGLSGVKDMIAIQNSMLIFADSGVYEVTGGSAPFSATNFFVRTVTDMGALSAGGITSTEFGIVYTSPSGIFTIAPDARSGRLSATSIVDDNIKTLWNDIPDNLQRYSQLVYDYCLQKLYLLYTDHTRADTASTHADSALVYDLRNRGWYRFRFPERGGIYPTDIRCAIVTRAGDGANDNKKVKFIATYAYISGFGIRIFDLDHANYIDYDGSQELPYLITAYDGIGGAEVPKDFAHRRQAPIVHVYSKRTETGVDGGGNPVNPSSIWIEPRWDFTDTNTTGRAGSPQQAHRPTQFFLGDPTDNGMPVVINRVKLRGRGRSLHLKFYGEAGKDMHLLGYAIQYRIGRQA